MNQCLKRCITLMVASVLIRNGLVASLNVFLTYCYSYIESTPFGIVTSLCSFLSDALAAVTVFSMLAGVYTLIRAKRTAGAAVCAGIFLVCNIAGEALSLFANGVLTRAGLSDMTVSMFEAEMQHMLFYVFQSFLSAVALVFFTFVFAYALRPASDKAARLFAVISYTLAALVSRASEAYMLVVAFGAPGDVYEVLNLSYPFIGQGIFAIGGYYLMKSLRNQC